MNWSPEDANFLKFASERELTPAAFPAYSPTPPAPTHAHHFKKQMLKILNPLICEMCEYLMA